MHIRFTLINAAIARVDDPERLLPAALAVARIANQHTVDHDWGPLLRALADRPEARRRHLAALVDNDDLWDPGNGNVLLALSGVGLPHDREACRALAA
ncbi:hypothetical protein ACIA5D_46020 [Actinoplanes sp. NPDC051513]|uniref:hypothetical protein n=1 Tax=Actinoplanes sp. NPDC051513 TaxID=3363908 RepID=UPI0037B51539